MRQYLTLAVDLGWVALSAVLAVLIRDNFVPYQPHLVAIAAYAATAVACVAVVFAFSGSHKALWQYTSLPDVLRIMAVVTIGLLLALFISFFLSRLEGVARSMPLIQWLLLLSAMVGTRVAVRIWHERTRADALARADAPLQHVLIVGLSHLTELYLQSVAEYASKTIDIVGILSEERELRGRLLRSCTVLGSPEELPQVMAQLEVHGITLDRIVVMQPFEQLSHRAGGAILGVERTSGVKVEWMVELLGLTEAQREDAAAFPVPKFHAMQTSRGAPEVAHPPLGKYAYVKRAFDILGAISLGVLLGPCILFVGLFVALDVGVPLVFWQKRPGRLGRPFKLFKFCSMRPAHDAQGNRLSDDERSSGVGRVLRRTRLDELPQLYNILIGEMAFVGPRPLLPVDQPIETRARLLLRPGLTGLAQVHGGRNISPEDKNALDIWYVQNASLWLDIKILLRTPIIMIRGERVDDYTLLAARACLEQLETQSRGSTDSCSLILKGAMRGGQVQSAHSLI